MKRFNNNNINNNNSKKQKNTSELVSKKRTNQIDFNFNSKKQKLNNNVIIYCRISTKNQSLEAQEFTCKEYCKNNSIKLNDWAEKLILNEIKKYDGK